MRPGVQSAESHNPNLAFSVFDFLIGSVIMKDGFSPVFFYSPPAFRIAAIPPPVFSLPCKTYFQRKKRAYHRSLFSLSIRCLYRKTGDGREVPENKGAAEQKPAENIGKPMHTGQKPPDNRHR